MGFQNEILIPNLTEPTGLAFAPDGRMLIMERAGRIRVVQPGTTQPDATPFLQLTNINTQEGERGLVGLALDPGFATNGFYYVFYTAASPLRDRVSRFTASGNTTDLATEQLIWQDDVQAGFWHHGGAVGVGPDGLIYISTGDHFDGPNDSQSLASYHGKILRVNPDGTVPTSNPFYDGSGPNLDAIWARGLRNPYRFSFDSVTGRLYIGDVGGNNSFSSIEEVDIGAAGANYGWPVCEGTCGTSGMTNPLFSYQHNNHDSAITGGFVYRGTQFPAEYYGSYFYGDYVRNWIKQLTFTSGGAVAANNNFEPADGSVDGPYGEIVDMKQGPDGALYYVDYGISWEGNVRQGQIRRIRYSAGNQPPSAVASATPTSGVPPLTVTFSSAGTTDPEGQPLNYSWDFGDGVTSTEANPLHTYQQVGNYTARLTVSDGASSSLSNLVSIVVGNRPAVSITTPTSGTTFRAGDVVTFSGTATDVEDGPLPASAYSWEILFVHDTHTHPALGPLTGVTSGTFTIPTTGHDFSDNTAYQITLTVTDSDGLKSNAFTIVYPEKVNLSFQSMPAGLSVSIDGIPRTTPFVLDTLIGFRHTIGAPDQAQGGSQYTFASWSDGGGQSHVITVPASDSAYTATFNVSSAPSQLALSYALNEGSGTTTADSSGSNYTGNLFNASWTTAGKFGNALAFNGSSSRVRSTANVALGTSFTLQAWVFNPSNAQYETILTVGGNRDLYLANGQIGFYNGTGDWLFGSPISTSTWHHIALTYDGSSLRAYLDGVQQGTAQQTALSSVSAPVQLGALIVGSSNTDWFGGTLDEVRVYNRALSQAEIQVDMNAPIAPSAPDTASPVLSNGQPTGQLPAGTSQATLQVTTNESATCRYSTSAGIAYASMSGSFTTTGGTAHSTTVGGLGDGLSYTYYLRCQDPSGNATTSDYSIAFSVASPPPPDGQPPVVSVSSPTEGATVSGTVTVTANASDDVAVAGVQFLLDGVNLGSEDSSAPYSISWNTTTAANGSHTLSARARDAAGNQATSLLVSVNVNNVAGPVGLVAAYGFEESGSQVVDSSSNANSGTISQAVRTSGRFGGGLQFDGVNDVVTVNDSASLDLVSGMTLEAWVRPTVLPTNFRSVVVKERATNSLAYQLAAGSNSSNRPANRVYAQGAVRTLFGGSQLGAGVWVHLAATYDGANQRLFVNGTQIASAAQTGALTATTNALRLGGSSTMGQYFNGTLDEVRVYNRALSQAEIQVDMNAPIAPSAPDTASPVLSNGQPTGQLPAGTSQATLQVTTNESATCRYSTSAGIAYASMSGSFTTTGGTAHSTTVGGLGDGLSYTYYLRCQDPSGNATTSDYSIAFSVASPPPPDGQPPVVSVSSPTEGATVSGTVTVTANASDDVAVAGVQFLLDGVNLGSEDSSAPYSISWNTTTAANGSHTLSARARDAAGNQATSLLVSVNVNNVAGPVGLVAAYALNEGSGTTTADSSGSNYTGNLFNASWTTAGKFGNALAFNGSSSRVRSTANVALGTSFTLQAWVFNPSNAQYETILTVGGNRDLYLANGQIGFYNGTSDWLFGSPISTSTWHHIALTYDGSSLRAYLDGVQQGTAQQTALSSVSAPVQLGALIVGSSNTDWFAGTLDEVRVYNRALSQAEIQVDMNKAVT